MSIFKLPEKLKKKSIKPAGRAQHPQQKMVSVVDPQTASPSDLEKMAMEAMSDLASKFPAWASGDVQKIKDYLNQLNGIFGEDRTEFLRTKVYPKVHDLKGQGSTFGYPLITDIGAHMCRLITSKASFSTSDVTRLKNDAQMMETVLWKKLKGDGGEKGAEILRKLR